MNGNKLNILLFVAAFALIGSAAFKLFNQRLGTRPSVEAIVSEQPTPAPQAIAEAESTDSSQPKIENTLAATPDCQSKPRSTKIPIDPKSFLRIAIGKQTALYFHSKEVGCIEADQEYELEEDFADPKTGLKFFEGFTMRVRAKKIENFFLPQMTAETFNALSFRDSEFVQFRDRLIIKFGQSEAERSPSYAIHLQVDQFNAQRTSYQLPLDHPLAKTISASQIPTVQNAVVVDIRRPSEFRRGAIPGAISYPLYIPKRGMQGMILSPRQLADIGIVFAPPEAMRNQDTPIVIYANNSLDYDGYNAITFLALHGYRNLYFLRNGYDELKGIPSITPQTAPNANVVDADTVVDLLKSIKTIVDVRHYQSFRDGTLKGATSIPMRQRLDDAGYPSLRKNGITVREIRSIGDSIAIQPPQNESRTILIFGESEYDWKAYKAAIWAAGLGWEVYWYRQGFAEWRTLARFFREKYDFIIPNSKEAGQTTRNRDGGRNSTSKVGVSSRRNISKKKEQKIEAARAAKRKNQNKRPKPKRPSEE